MPFLSIPCGGREQGLLAAILLAVLVPAGPAVAASDDGPGFISLVEGAATSGQARVQEPAAEGQELRAGDRLTTAPGGRVEVVLAGRTTIHVAGDSALVFAELGGHGESADVANLLLLERGELLLASDGETETRIDTDDATVYLGAGAYRLEHDGVATRVIVRRGEAELRTRRGGLSLAEGEQASIQGDGARVVPAGEPDALERWAAVLFELRERWAWCPQCRRGLWSFWSFWSFEEEDGGPDVVYTDFAAGEWDDGAPGCFQHPGGGARRTRPPHPPTAPGQSAGNSPGRVAVPVPRDSSDAAGGEIEARSNKPWPLDDSSADTVPTPVEKPRLEGDDPWLAASVGGSFAEPPAASAAPVEPSGDQAGDQASDQASDQGWRLESAASRDEGSPSTGSPDDTPAAEISTTGNSGSDVATADSSATTTDASAWTSDTSTAGAETPSSGDDSSSSAGFAGDTGASDAGFVDAAPARDPEIEPNR